MTHSELIEALGGGTKVASLVSELSGHPIDREAVYKWAKLNSVPWRWRPYVARVAQEENVELPAGFLPDLPASEPREGVADARQ